MKSKTIFTCSECGYTSGKWLGKCPECNNWNSFVEEIMDKEKDYIAKTSRIIKEPIGINDVKLNTEERFSSGISELDRVLGKGIVRGSLVLISGEPGIGKSTLLLQICSAIRDKVLYISGEESESQIKLRAKRLEILSDNIDLLCDTNLESATNAILSVKPSVAIVDSVQTISSDEISSPPGSVTQIKEVTMTFMKIAKSLNITIFLVGHITKSGSIAGPKILEHMVDSVIYFEGDNTHAFRLLRAVKNRFGPTNEVGIFEMNDKGLECVSNPSLALIDDDSLNNPGTCVTCTIEGTRPILSEVQSLVVPTFFPVPRRMASGVDYNRLTLLLAVAEKKLNLNIVNHDVYINIAGGMRISEPSCDLAIILSVFSNRKNITIDNKTIAFGEVGLLGEVRPISFVDSRIREAKKLGFKKIILPQSNYDKLKDKEGIIGVKNVIEATKIFAS